MTTGTGRYRSLGEATSAVKTALYEASLAALAAAGESQVDVGYGFVWPTQYDDALAWTAHRAAPDEGTVGPQLRRRYTVYQDASIVVFRVTDSEREVQDRAYALLAVIDEHLRTDPTLGGAVEWCLSDELTSDAETEQTGAGAGRLCEIAVTYAAHVIVSR